MELMYITNRPEVAKIAENAGVDRIFVDMEYIGKEQRQGMMNTVISSHKIEDIKAVADVISKAELLVRVNPIHERSVEYSSSREEIDAAIDAGAEILMLPYFKTVSEVHTFIDYVNGRARTMLLVETPEAVDVIDEILDIEGVDEFHIGLNDLSLGYGKKFMFELLCDNTVEYLSKKFNEKGKKFGIGGIASLGKGMLPAEKIIIENYRLGSKGAILSRSFCDVTQRTDLEEIRKVFDDGVKEIREFEKQISKYDPKMDKQFFEDNLREIKMRIKEIVG